VKAGQSLAAIDTPELDAELLAAKAKLNAAIAQVAVKQAQADFAETTEQRWRNSPKGVVSDQEREAKSAGKAEAIAELSAARAQVALQQADADRLTVLTQFKDVKAPFEGTIVRRSIDIGDLVTAGSTANTSSLYRLSSDNPIRIFVHVPQSVASEIIADGANVEITNGDEPTLRLEGRVTRTAKAIDPGSRKMRVEIDLPNPDRALVPGMCVQSKFKFKGAPGFQVPAAALLFRSSGPPGRRGRRKRRRGVQGRLDRQRRWQRGFIGLRSQRRRSRRAQSQQSNRRRRQGQGAGTSERGRRHFPSSQ
jgi:RND family efflux transporter MFP subunit